MGTHCEIAPLRWMPQNSTNEESTLVQVMAWYHQATSHYVSQCWPRSVLSYATWWNCQPWPSRSQNWMFVHFIIILSRSQQFPASLSQNQVELGEWATGHFMHCHLEVLSHNELIVLKKHSDIVFSKPGTVSKMVDWLCAKRMGYICWWSLAPISSELSQIYQQHEFWSAASPQFCAQNFRFTAQKHHEIYVYV